MRGVSAVFGNAPLARTFSIAQEIVRRFGPSTLEVVEGAARAEQLGEDTSASRALAAALARERLTVLALGPVTNVATVVKNHPALVSQIEEVVVVAGRRPGQRFTVGSSPGTAALRDLNFELDPDGMQTLLDADVPLVLAPFEISSKVLVTRDDADRLASGSDVLAWFTQPMADWLQAWRDRFAVDGFHPFDTLAVAYVTSPDWVRCEDMPAEIQQLPDDTRIGSPADGPREKPYLLVSENLHSGRQVRYCFDVAPEFKTDLLDRLLRE